jgi:hypothetical protein
MKEPGKPLPGVNDIPKSWNQCPYLLVLAAGGALVSALLVSGLLLSLQPANAPNIRPNSETSMTSFFILG